MKYQLPCDACGKAILVETSQAGRRLACECGNQMEAPSLRDIRELEPAKEAATPRAKRSWTPARGLAFAAGLVLVLLGILPAGYGIFVRSRLVLSKREPVPIEIIAEDTNSLTMVQTLELFQEARTSGLGPYITPPHIMMRQVDKFMMVVTWIGIVMFAGGVLSLAGAMLTPAGPRRKR